MRYISFGCQCSTAKLYELQNIKGESMPFDWIISSPKVIYEILYVLLIEKMDIIYFVTRYFFTNLLKYKMININEKYIAEHFIADPDGTIGVNECYFLNKQFNLLMPHDRYNIIDTVKYIRRFTRLVDILLDPTEEITCIYTSESSPNKGNYTVDNNKVIKDVYHYMNLIYDLLLFNRQKHNTHLIIFDSLLEEDEQTLNPNISLIYVAQQQNWVYMISEIAHYYSYILKNDIKSLLEIQYENKKINEEIERIKKLDDNDPNKKIHISGIIERKNLSIKKDVIYKHLNITTQKIDPVLKVPGVFKIGTNTDL